MITVTVSGLDQTRAKLDEMKAKTQNLEPALLRSGIVALKAAMDRIDAGGPGWAPNVTGTPLLHQTGRLLSSLTIGAAGNVERIDSNTIVVGTNVFYASWLQSGTGIFGPAGKRIEPKNSKAMVFTIGGKKVFASSIAGAPQRPFLFIDQNVAEHVRDVFAKYVLGDGYAAVEEA